MELTRGSQPVKGDHTVHRSSTQSRKPPSPSFNQSDGPSSRSSSRNSTRSPFTHATSPIVHKNDRRTPSPGGLKNKKKKSKDGKDTGGGEGKQSQSPRNPSPSTLKYYNSSGDEKSSSQPHRRSRSGPPTFRTKGGKPGSRGSTPTNDAAPDDSTNQAASHPTKRRSTVRAPTELDKTFLATSSNQHIADDDFHDMELEEIQSQLQERAAKVIQHTGFTRFSSSALCVDPSQADQNIQIKKVSPRRPSLNSQISNFTASDFDAVSETSDISSSRLNVSGGISQHSFTVDNAAQAFDAMSISELER